MSDLEEQLNSILGDPEQMDRIASLAKSLMGGGEAAAPPVGADAGRLASLAQKLMGEPDDKQALIEAMKPWLSEKRRRKMERALKLAHMAKLAELAMGEGGGGQNDV